MSKSLLQRGLLAFATIDALLICAASGAFAAPAHRVADASPTLPSLLLLGIGTVAVGLGLRRH